MAGGAWRIDGGREAGGWQSEAIPTVTEPCENALVKSSQVLLLQGDYSTCTNGHLYDRGHCLID